MTFPGGQPIVAVFVAAHPKADLAAIACNVKAGAPFVPLAKTHPIAGDDVCQVGYPMGRLAQRRGKVSGYRETTEGVRLFYTAITTDQGDSGSGIFLTREKALCGIMWGGHPGQTVATEWKVCKEFFETQCQIFRPRKPAPPVQPGQPLPISPLPAVNGLAGKMQDLAAKMKEIEANLQALHAGVAGIPAQIDAHGKALDAKLQPLAGIGPRLADFEAKIKGLPPIDPAKLAAIDGVLAKVAAFEANGAAPAGLLASLIPIGAATGGVGVPVILAGWGLLKFLAAKNSARTPAVTSGQIQASPNTSQTTTPLLPLPQATLERTVPQYVPTTITDPWATALTQALTKVEQNKLTKTPAEILSLAEELYAGLTGKAK